jgi:TM2 domain-containing membrane protein YozV
MCGAPLENEQCGYCGYAEKKTITIHNFTGNTSGIIPGVSRKSKKVALMLCVFLGIFGAHKFYVGKIGMGILYLFTFGLFGFGWIVDIILIAMGSFKDEFDLPLCQ